MRSREKGIRAWALGATAPYSISTVKKVLKEPADFSGTPLRAGSALHTIMLEKLGATPVTLPGSQAFEAASRGTIEGLDHRHLRLAVLLAAAAAAPFDRRRLDWPLGELSGDQRRRLEQLSDEQKALFDKTARDVAAIERGRVGGAPDQGQETSPLPRTAASSPRSTRCRTR
jgi:hypothetical protein